jgi:hypothetical protein
MKPTQFINVAALGASTRREKATSTPARWKLADIVHRGGSFLCNDQYCSRYIVGTRQRRSQYRNQPSWLPLREIAGSRQRRY